MQPTFLIPVLHTLRAGALFDDNFTRALSAVHGVSLRDVMLMRYVRVSAGAKLSRIDLAKRLYVSPSTVTRATKPLEKIGLIGRESDPRDARLSYVVLTATGLKLLKQAEKTLEQLSDDFLSQRLSAKDLNQLNALLGKLTGGFPGEILKIYY